MKWVGWKIKTIFFLSLQKPHNEIRNKTNSTKYSSEEATTCSALLYFPIQYREKVEVGTFVQSEQVACQVVFLVEIQLRTTQAKSLVRGILLLGYSEHAAYASSLKVKFPSRALAMNHGKNEVPEY